MAQKLFRDPLYDYIPIDIDKYPWLFELIKSPLVQRLRYINQLGLSHFTYPGANHSRFSHCLGVLHLMKQCLDHLKNTFSEYLKRLDEEALLAAALLHDIGHGPLSHATESIFGDHEQRGIDLIKNKNSEVYKILYQRDKTLPNKVIGFLSERSTAPLWQKSLISSQLDLDRLDYIRRDSLCSGAEYGNFDWFRIIHTMMLKKRPLPASSGETQRKITEIVWPDKTKFALEEYLFSRFYMYQSVYFHHTTRAFENLLKKILERGKILARSSTEFANKLLPPMRMIVNDNDPTSFLMLTDYVLLTQISIWQDSKDKILSDLSKRLISRRGIGWKPVELTSLNAETIMSMNIVIKHRLSPKARQ